MKTANLNGQTYEVRPGGRLRLVTEIAHTIALAARLEPGPVRPRALRAAVALRKTVAR